MSFICVSHKDLNDFRRNGSVNDISKLKRELVNKINQELSLDLSDDILELDYATPEIDLPGEYIPFKFTFRPNTEKIDELLQNYLILVSWNNQTTDNILPNRVSNSVLNNLI